MSKKYSNKHYVKVWDNTFLDRKPKFDAFGKPIKFESYGDPNSDYGWEIDHIWPESKDGANNFENFQPLHHQSNDQKDNMLKGEVFSKSFEVEEHKTYSGNKKIGRMYISGVPAYKYERWQSK